MSLPDLVKSFDGYGEYVIVNRAIVDDGEGGTMTTWTDGAHFFGAVILDNSVEMRTALAQGVQGAYTVTTEKRIALPWHTVFRRLSDGQVFRVTSREDNAAPSVSTIQTRIVTAEEWVIPADE